MVAKYLRAGPEHWACDIESNGFRAEATRIHCVCIENIQDGRKLSFFDAATFKKFLAEADRILIGHNFLAFDAPVLNRLWDCSISVKQVIDTFVLSQMYSPNLAGGHSLEAWGERLNNPKGGHTDFSEFSPAMLEYCQQDASLTADVYRALIARLLREGFSEQGVELEHLAWHIIQNKQKQNGFPFDQQKADLLYAELRAREQQLKEEIQRLWPPVLEHVRTFAKSRKSDGTPTANYQRHLGQYPKLEEQRDGSYHAYDYVEFDLGSPQQRIQKLLDLGWQPVNYTPKGQPKVDEDELLAFAEISGVKEAAALARWVVVNARANMVKTWIDAVNPATGHIHGSLFLASTGRYKHSGPNTANIPGVRHDKEDNILFGEPGTWAYECRSLWTSGGPPWKLVGIDGKGMQLRCLAHNVARIVGVDEAQEFINDVLNGDPHKRNQARLGLPNKPASKKFLYTTLMGGGGAKLAIDQAQFGLKLSPAEGNELKNLLIDGIPGFRKLIQHLTTELQNTGRITLCDGTRLLVPSPHMVIPYLLQGDESRLMKQAMIYTDQEVRRAGISREVFKVGDIHDEWQTRVMEDVVEEYVPLALRQFPKAGERFDYNILIEGDANVGDNWAETH